MDELSVNLPPVLAFEVVIADILVVVAASDPSFPSAWGPIVSLVDLAVCKSLAAIMFVSRSVFRYG
jgi:hypothetical protein